MRWFNLIAGVFCLSGLFSQPAAAFELEDLQGSWSTGCERFADFYGQLQMHFEDRTQTLDLALFHDDQCSVEAATWSSVFDIELGEEVQDEVRFVDMIHRNHTRVAYSADAVALYNEVAECQFNDWDQGLSIDATGKTCGQSVMSPMEMPESEVPFYSAAQIKDGMLKWGNFAEDEDDRTDELIDEVVFVKVQ